MAQSYSDTPVCRTAAALLPLLIESRDHDLYRPGCRDIDAELCDALDKLARIADEVAYRLLRKDPHFYPESRDLMVKIDDALAEWRAIENP